MLYIVRIFLVRLLLSERLEWVPLARSVLRRVGRRQIMGDCIRMLDALYEEMPMLTCERI